MVRGIKKKDYERLDDATIARVVLLLEQDKPVTKKAACEILNISYNTKRLDNIIQEHKDKIEYNEKRMKANKGRAFNELEIKEMVVAYLSGESYASIARGMFRSINIVKNFLKSIHMPERSKTATYQKPDLLPEEMVSDNFEIKEMVWSSRYNCVGEIKKYLGEDKDLQAKIYCLWVFGKYNQFACQPAWELGKLEILKQFKLRDDEFVTTQQSLDYRIE